MRPLRDHAFGALGFGVGCVLGTISMFTLDMVQGVDGSPVQSGPSDTHHYRLISTMIACGAEPADGWDGCVGAEAETLECVDGAHVIELTTGCTSPGAADRERDAQIAAVLATTTAEDGVCIQEHGSGTMIHFTTKMGPPGSADASYQWMYLWGTGRRLNVLYATDYEHLEHRLSLYSIQLSDSASGA